jgi:hypothetical protein
MSLQRFKSLVVVLGVAAATPAVAQVGSTTDIITGQVTNQQGAPVPGAQVTATSLETGVNRSRTTNAEGRYTILFPDGGGRYQLVVRALGQAPAQSTIERNSDEDRLVANVKLGAAATPTLSTVTVRARQGGPQTQQRPEPGNSERLVSTEQASRLPVDQNDLNALAALAPGVVSTSGNDSTPAGFSVAGQRPTQNNLTLDGVSFGSSSIPQEAVRGTRVITNTFDVARGQFTGGQIASTTRGGTNRRQGSATYSLRTPALQWNQGVSGPYGRGYTQNLVSGGFGGPIVQDKAFYFISGQYSRRTDPLTSLIGADPFSLEQIGVSADSVRQFLTTLQTLGIDPNQFLSESRASDNAGFLGRLDWSLGENHSLTFRADARRTEQRASRISPFGLPLSGGDAVNWGGGFMATLTSRFGDSFINEFRAYASSDDRSTSPYVTFPQGQVRVTSDLANGARGTSMLSFGTNASLPSSGEGATVESTNELSWISAGGAHRFKLGALLNASRYSELATFNTYGTYTFNSLEDFASGSPAQFTRSLLPNVREGSAINAALYLGDTWRPSRALQLTYGARIEGSAYTGAPAQNPAIASAFGLQTDEFPGEVRVSPRVGFSYTFYGSPREGQQQGFPHTFLRGGVGEFRGRAPSQLFAAAQQSAGLAGGQSQIVCIGPGVPAPDWPSYSNGGAIPTSCAAGGPVFSAARPGVTAFNSDFSSPRSWRASLGLTRRFWERWAATLDAQYAIGTALYGVTDRNLDAVPEFTLSHENGRPVFVPSSAIVPTTGITSVQASRRTADFGQVFEIGSGLTSRNMQVTTSLNAFTARGAVVNLSYTHARATDQSSWAFGPAQFGFGGPTTAGNPNVLESGTSDLERRHNFVGTLTWPFNPSVEITMFGRLTSGAPYTPLVGGDINGDGARNDRAFIFEPNAAGVDAAVADGMRRLLAATSGNARECLESQLGGIAGRNTCRESWFPSLDFQLNIRPNRWGLKRRLAIQTVVSNPLGGLDQLLHGSENLRGWGQPSRPDNTLLYVRGFDQSNNRYIYEVNERFGSARNSVAFRQPFQLGIQLRYSWGGANSFAGGGFGAFGGPGGGGGGGRFGGGPPGAMAAPSAGAQAAGGQGDQNSPLRMLGRQGNPLARIIEMRDLLTLTDTQVVRLQLLSDSLVANTDSLGRIVRGVVEKAGANPDPAALFAQIRPHLNRGRGLLEQALRDAQSVLTAEQWAQVPEDVKNPFRPPGAEGQRGRPQGE